MLTITIVTLLITNNVISGIQAKAQEERKAQFNGTLTPVYKSDSVNEALKVQKRDTLNIVPESYVEQTNHVDESQRGNNRLRRDLPTFKGLKPMKDLVLNFSAFDAPSNRTGSRNFLGSRIVQKDFTFTGNYSKDTIYEYASHDKLYDNAISSDPNAINIYGPIIKQENFNFLGENEIVQCNASTKQIGNNDSKNSGQNNIYTDEVVQKCITYAKNPGNKTLLPITINESHKIYPKSIENNKDALKPVIDQSGNFYLSNNDSEAEMNTKHNTESQVYSAKQNATDSQQNSSPTNYDFDSSSHEENEILYNKEREVYAVKPTVFNRQMSLSYNVFYLLSYSSFILLKYSLFQYVL